MNNQIFSLCLAIILVATSVSCTKQDKNSIELENPGLTPELFGKGIISTSGNERDIAISPAGDEIFYTLNNIDNTRRAIVRVTLDSQGKVITQEVADFSGDHKDIEPAFSPDGKKLFFCSNRPVEERDTTLDYNIWYVEKENGQWGKPLNVGDAVNTETDEFYPSVAANGNLYYTASYDDAKGLEDIFMSEFKDGSYQKPVSLDTAVNTAKYEFNACISPKEDVIIFSSFGRKDDTGGGDLYFSIRDSAGNWTEARNAGSNINSGSIDYCPFVDWNRKVFYFSSNRRNNSKEKVSFSILKNDGNEVLNGLGNIYQVNLKEILRTK